MSKSSSDSLTVFASLCRNPSVALTSWLHVWSTFACQSRGSIHEQQASKNLAARHPLFFSAVRLCIHRVYTKELRSFKS
jgi:hypothetical protein